MAIHDVHDDDAAQAYKAHFKQMYSDKLTHGEWAQNTVGEFATAVQVWQGSNSNFYCTHFRADSEDDVYKQLKHGKCRSFLLEWSFRQIDLPSRLCLKTKRSTLVTSKI